MINLSFILLLFDAWRFGVQETTANVLSCLLVLFFHIFLKHLSLLSNRVFNCLKVLLVKPLVSPIINDLKHLCLPSRWRFFVKMSEMAIFCLAVTIDTLKNAFKVFV